MYTCYWLLCFPFSIIQQPYPYVCNPLFEGRLIRFFCWRFFQLGPRWADGWMLNNSHGRKDDKDSICFRVLRVDMYIYIYIYVHNLCVCICCVILCYLIVFQYISLYRIWLHCIILYYIVLYCIILYVPVISLYIHGFVNSMMGSTKTRVAWDGATRMPLAMTCAPASPSWPPSIWAAGLMDPSETWRDGHMKNMKIVMIVKIYCW